MLSEVEKMLIEYGSVDALGQVIGQQSASDALYSLSLRVPEEIRGVWYMVIAWGRLQIAYETAMKFGDVAKMTMVVEKQLELVEKRYK